MDPVTQQYRRCYAMMGMGGVLAVLGILLLAISVYRIMEAKQSSGWPSTPGIMQQSEYRSTNIAIKQSTVARDHDIDLAYHYEVDGRKYTGKKLKMVDSTTLSEQTARNVVAKYPVGSSVKVYYDPANPSKSCLETGMVGLHWAMLLGGFAAIAVGSFVVWGMRRMLSKIPKAA